MKRRIFKPDDFFDYPFCFTTVRGVWIGNRLWFLYLESCRRLGIEAPYKVLSKNVSDKNKRKILYQKEMITLDTAIVSHKGLFEAVNAQRDRLREKEHGTD